MTKTLKEEIEIIIWKLYGLTISKSDERLYKWFDQKLKEEYSRGARNQALLDADTLKEQRQEIIKEIEKMKIKNDFRGIEHSYNLALSEVIELIKKYEN